MANNVGTAKPTTKKLAFNISPEELNFIKARKANI